MRPLTARRETGPVPLPRMREEDDPARLRRDPAPSRLTYRVQRLWLTPLFRALLRIGLPAFVVIATLLWYATDEQKVQALVDQVAEIRREIEDRPEFRVSVMGIEGAGPALTEEVRGTLALDLPLSSFDLDLDDLRDRVEALPAVRAADLRIRSGGYLAVTLTERVPALIWQTRDGAMLIDADGTFVAGLDQRDLAWPLPMIAGDGADRETAEALRLLAAAAPLGDRLHGLVRMGERRWDVVLRDGRRILLPETDARDALDRVLALHDATDLLGRDVLRVDLRAPERLSVQLTPEALEDYRALRALETQGRNGDGQG